MHTKSSINRFAVVSIPILILWNVQIPIRKKLILYAIFSITIVVMVVSIVRVAVVKSADENVDISWLYLWSSIEMTACK